MTQLSPTQAYVRTEMLDQKAPPAGQSGATRWLRENLFATPFDAILTVVFAAFVGFLLWTFLPWFVNGIWDATSVDDCRAQFAAAGTHEAACWAVIKHNWPLFIFGYYPVDLYWRPVLAFVLLIVALLPILFASAPRSLLLFSVLYPAVAIFLLWGGSAWTMILMMAGFAIGWAVVRFLLPVAGSILTMILTIVLPVLYWIFAWGPLTDTLHAATPWLSLTPVSSDRMGGFLLALIIGVAGISFSLPLGILLALGRRSDMPLVKYLSVGFIELIRGVPLITLLFVAQLLLNYFMPPGTNFDIILRVVILVTLFAAAYIAEVIRGGLAALPRGQYEAADALGLTYWQAQQQIIMPQALKISIPGIVSSFIALFKDTTLVTFISLADPLKTIPAQIQAVFAWKAAHWEPLIFTGFIFFLFCFSMSRYSMYLERKLKRDHR